MGSFSDNFQLICKKKKLDHIRELTLYDLNDAESKGRIVSFDGIQSKFNFTNVGIDFESSEGKGKYTWDELDLILSENMQFNDEILKTYKKPEILVKALSQIAGAFIFICAIILLYCAAMLIFVGSDTAQVAETPGILQAIGDFLRGIIVLIAIIAFVVTFGYVIIFAAISTSVMIIGGMVGIIGKISVKIEPLIHRLMPERFKEHNNAAYIIKHHFIKYPFGYETDQLIYLITLGVKIYRRMKYDN